MNIFKWFIGKLKTEKQVDYQDEEKVFEGNPYVKAKLQQLHQEILQRNLDNGVEGESE